MCYPNLWGLPVCDFWSQFLTQFSMLSQMVPFFLLSMAAYKTSRESLLIGSLYYFHQSGDGYLGCHREQNGWHHLKEHWKPVQKLVSKVTYHFVEGHLSRKQTVAYEWVVWLKCLSLSKVLFFYRQKPPQRSKDHLSYGCCIFNSQDQLQIIMLKSTIIKGLIDLCGPLLVPTLGIGRPSIL